jgi:hypothetical protein
MVEVDGIKTHALLDTGAGSSYASSSLPNAFKRKPKAVKTKQIEMMLGPKIEIHCNFTGKRWKRCNTNLPVYSSPVWTDLLPILSRGRP